MLTVHGEAPRSVGEPTRQQIRNVCVCQVLPGLLNEYRIPELNVQNGVLKSMSFLFEYIGEMGRDYVYAVVPLIEDAMMDRDLVHRQTACTTVKHMALGSIGTPPLLARSPHFVPREQSCSQAVPWQASASKMRCSIC